VRKAVEPSNKENFTRNLSGHSEKNLFYETIYFQMSKNKHKTVFIGVSPKQRVFATGQAGGDKSVVFVGVSGGVDSSVAAALLKDQGYNVVGVFIRTWTPDFIECTWRDERRDAMRVCAHLGIPFLECDAEEEYKKGVADYMIEEYKKGNTPNPDVMCNREVKFGVFWKFAKAHGADYIATGHYAVNNYQLQITNEKRKPAGKDNCFSQVLGRGGREPVPDHSKSNYLFQLSRSPDQSKDQSYFLWTLTQEDLSHVLFPIGHLKKTEVRKLAEKYKLPTATKKDSQGVCFLGPLDMKDFLKHYIESKKGEVLLVPSEPVVSSIEPIEGKEPKVIGYHSGAVFFTLGERHGFTITEKSEKDKPYYVVGKDIEKNTITVSTSPKNSFLKGPRISFISIINTNWIINPPIPNKNYQAQIRYHGELLNCRIICTSPTGAEVTFEKDILVDIGQSVVVYDGDTCLGGGIVT